MNITVKYTGRLCTLTGKEKESIEVEEDKHLQYLIDVLADKYEIQPLLDKGVLFLINDKIAKREQVLADGDAVHIFQMMAGG